MLTLVSLLFVTASTPPPVPLTAAELVHRSEATLTRISEGGARWLVRQKLGQSMDLGVRVTRFGSAEQFDFLLFEGATEKPFFSISAREGVWSTLFAGAKQPIASRPYEVFLPMLSAYLLLAKCDLQLLAAPEPMMLARETRTTSTWVSARAPGMDEALKTLLSRMQAMVGDAGATDPRMAELEKKVAALPLVEVDNATGIVLHAGPQAERGLFFSELEVLTKRPAILEGDLPSAPPPLDLDFLANGVALSWDPTWKPGGPERDSDMLLINFDKATQRRVPNRYGLTGQAAFLTPRTQLVVTTTMPKGGLRPLWIDLTTGENRLLGDAWGAVPVVLFPVASPDGKRVSVLSQEAEPLTMQLQVIDVATGAVRNVGTPADQVFVNWLPDDGFVLVRRVRRAGEKEPLSRIVRLSRDGKETELVSNATRPVVLSPQEMVFKDLSSGKWMVSDLAGKKRRLLGDGVASLFAPTPSPDGEVLLMMEATPATEARFVIVKTGEVLKESLGRGLWSNPQWR